jgi:hypothetical protein
MMAAMSDGTTSDITAETSWTILPPLGIANVSEKGVVSAVSWPRVEPGTERITTLSGQARGRVVTRTIRIIAQPGTFTLSGSVTFNGAEVPGVRIEVTSGSATGQVAISNGFGGFALVGLIGDVDISVAKQGYVEQRHRVNVSAHQRLALVLDGLTPVLDVSGVYSLTITAGMCDAGFPVTLRTRPLHGHPDDRDERRVADGERC